MRIIRRGAAVLVGLVMAAGVAVLPSVAQAAPVQQHVASAQVAQHVSAKRCTNHTHSYPVQPRRAKTHVYRACGRKYRALALIRFVAGNHWVYGHWKTTGQTSTAYGWRGRHVIYFGRQWRECTGCTIHTKTWAASIRTWLRKAFGRR